MKISLMLLHILVFTACNTGALKTLANLPKTLNEVSGTEKTSNSSTIWMLNDSGNKAKIYAVNKKGTIKQTVQIKAKNHDWEDLTSDSKNNLYIGDFGNNLNDRKNLKILKFKQPQLKDTKIKDIAYITFKYEDQKNTPSKKKNMYFDCEAFFYFNNALYLFTKSRVKNNYGKTTVYKIPATQGDYVAKPIDSFFTGKDLEHWITSADISENGKKVALLTQQAVWVFQDFKGDAFFNGTHKVYPFKDKNQKEAVCFKDKNTLFITSEKGHDKSSKLYQLHID